MSNLCIEKPTVERLDDWGRWARTGRIHLGSVGTLGNLNGSTVSSLDVPDDEAEIIDRIVAKLLFRDHQMGTVIKMHYEYGKNYRYIAKKEKMNKDKVNRLVVAGVAWIDAALVFRHERVA